MEGEGDKREVADAEDEEGKDSYSESIARPGGKKKREKSLGQLCLQFIALFIRKSRELSLEQAASMLSCQIVQEDHKMKTKVYY